MGKLAFSKIRASISGKLIAAILMISSVVTLAITATQISFDFYADVSDIQKSLELLKNSHLESITKSMWDLNKSQIETEVSGIMSIPGVEYIEIWDEKGTSVISKGVSPTGKSISVDYPLEYENMGTRNRIGHLKIVAGLNQVIQKIYRKIFLIFITQFLKTILVSTFIYFAIHSLLTKHLSRITNYVRQLDFKGKDPSLKLLRRRSPHGQEDELDVLVSSILSMQEKLYQSYEELNLFNQGLEKKIEEKTQVIIEQRQKLEYSTKMSALGEMAGGIAHEINTPLAVIRLKSEILARALQKGNVDEVKFLSDLQKITETADRIAKIVEGLRFFARDGRQDSIQKASLDQIIENTLSLCQERFKKYSVELEKQVPPGLEIECRSVEISQVLLNLLNNAFDAISDLPEKWIRIQVETRFDEVLIKVIDSGSGIPEEYRNKIMQPFFTTKEVGKGTGLGLSLSAGIVRAHGGEIKLDPDQSNTCFVVRLPIKQNASQIKAAA